MHRDVDKILDEIIEKKRNSGYGIIWEELFRVDYKKAYEKAKADYPDFDVVLCQTMQGENY